MILKLSKLILRDFQKKSIDVNSKAYTKKLYVKADFRKKRSSENAHKMRVFLLVYAETKELRNSKSLIFVRFSNISQVDSGSSIRSKKK